MKKELYTENIFKTIADIILSPILKRALSQGKRQSKYVDPELTFLIQSLEMDRDKLDSYYEARCKNKDNAFCAKFRAEKARRLRNGK